MKGHDILSQIDRKSGMTVPENYFSDFNTRMASSLPEQPWEHETVKVMPRTVWQKIRPYVYMAAMFMGIWCMMNMFSLVHPGNSPAAFSDNPVLMSAINNDDFYVDYCYPVVDEDYIYDQLYEDGIDPADFI